MMYFKFFRREQKPVEYRTLADVPEGVRCVVEDGEPGQNVRLRKGRSAYDTLGRVGYSSDSYRVVQILDPIHESPLPKTLDDVEDLRCIKLVNNTDYYFRHGQDYYRVLFSGGHVMGAAFISDLSVESQTDIWAVVCEVGP